MTLREWAYANGLGERYEEYCAECAEIREMYGDHSDDAELCIAQNVDPYYPDLLG